MNKTIKIFFCSCTLSYLSIIDKRFIQDLSQQVDFYRDENFISCNTAVNNKRDSVSRDYNIRGKAEICSHENKHIKRLFLKFVNAYYDQIKALQKIRESMTFAGNVLSFGKRSSLIMQMSSSSNELFICCLASARNFVPFADKNNFYSTVTFFGQL